MRKEIKKLIAATMSMALVLGVGNMVNSSAAEKKIAYRAFSFKVESGYAATKNKGDTVKRTTNDVSNAWGVNFKTSDEPTKDNKKHIEIVLLDDAALIVDAGLNAQKQFAKNVLSGLTEEKQVCINIFDKICNNAEEH